MSGLETRAISALAEAFVPGPAEGGAPLEPSDPRVLENVARTLGDLPADERVGCRLLFTFVLWLPWLTGPVRGRLDRLAPADRRLALERLRLSRWRFFRYLYFCLKSTIVMAYWARPETWSAIGYDGPWLGRVPVAVLEPPPLARGPLPEAPQRPVIVRGRGA